MLPALLLLALTALPASGGSGDPAKFEASMAQVRRTMDAGRWKEAKALLKETLDAHAEEAYVREKLDDLRGMTKRCAVELAHPRKDVKAVFCGEVASFDAKSGEIVLRWKRAPAKKGSEEPAFPCDDFESTKRGSVLRLPFDGPHAIEISGKAIGQETPVIRVCIEEERSYEIALDAGSSCTIRRIDGDIRVPIADSTNGYNVARPYKIEVAVRAKEIDASHNGKRMVHGEKDEDAKGRVGFEDVLEPDKIEVRGKASKAWIEERIEALTKKDREAFEKSYDPDADLPAWLRKS